MANPAHSDNSQLGHQQLLLQLYPSVSSEAGSGYAPGFQPSMPKGGQLPAYSSGPSPVNSPATPPPPSYMPGTAGPYASMGAPGVESGDAMAYSLGPGAKGCPGPNVMYQPVASGQPQVVIINEAGSELPVSPHPAVALVLGLISVLCCCCCVCGIPAIILGALALGKHPRSQVEQQSANTMSKIGLALGVVGLVAGALGVIVYLLLVFFGAATKASCIPPASDANSCQISNKGYCCCHVQSTMTIGEYQVFESCYINSKKYFDRETCYYMCSNN